MNAAEDRLSEIMDAATCALDPPIDAILAAGERLGRARKRRRHIALVAGTAAVVLLAGAGVATGIHESDLGGDYDAAGHATRPSHPVVPVPDSRSPALTSNPTPSPSPTDALGLAKLGLKPGEVPINATAAVNILRKLVPPTWKFGSYQPSSPGSLLRVNVEDGNGLAQIFVSVAKVENSGMDPVDCALQGLGGVAVAPSPTSPALNGGASPPSNPGAALGTAGPSAPECYVENTAYGDKAMLEVLVSPPSKVVIDRVIANRADGIAIEITAQNGDPESTANEVTRVWPPLDVETWAKIALNPIWQLYVPAALAQ